MERFNVDIWRGDPSGFRTVYYVIDTLHSIDGKPNIVTGWAYPDEPNARFLAEDFCSRHNATATATSEAPAEFK